VKHIVSVEDFIQFSILVLHKSETNGGSTCPLIVGIFCRIHMLSSFNHSTNGNRKKKKTTKKQKEKKKKKKQNKKEGTGISSVSLQ